MGSETNSLQTQFERVVFCIIILFLLTLVLYEGEQTTETILVPEDDPVTRTVDLEPRPLDFEEHRIPKTIGYGTKYAPKVSATEDSNFFNYEALQVSEHTDCGMDWDGWLGNHHLAETCMMTILRNDSCNHKYFVHAADRNCKCIPPKRDCINNQRGRRGMWLYRIEHANMSQLDHAITRVHLGDQEVSFRRYRPGQNSSVSMLMYKRIWTPHKVHADSNPFCHVSVKYKVVYMKSPKAGSSLFSWFMSDAMESKFGHCVYDWSDPQRRLFLDTNMDNAGGSRIYLDDYLFFGSIREPLSRFISGFKESSRRVVSAGGRGGISPQEKANFYQYKNLSHFIDGVYKEDFSKVYDIHLHEQIGMLLLSRHQMSYVIRLEHAADDWMAFQNLFPDHNMPPISDKYLTGNFNGKNLAKTAITEIGLEDIRKACWLLRREYCALSYPLPVQCTDLFSCVEMRFGNHTIFMPEPDVETRLGDLAELLVYPQDLLQIHLNEQISNKT